MTRRALAVAAAALALAGCAHGPSRKERQAAEVRFDLGREALRQGRWTEALRELDAALAVDSDFPEAHVARGIAYELGYGRTADAERDYRRALALRPDYPEAHNNLGQLLARSGRRDEALREFDAALANTYYAEPFIARCNRGEVLHALGRRDEGKSEMRACLAAAPRYCAGYRQLGRVELQDGRVKEALDALGRYADLCGSSPDAWLQVGQARMKAGDGEGAREAFRKCAELPGDETVRDECGRTAERLQ